MNNILEINERILYIIKKQYNNNKKKFAEHIGYSAQVVNNIVSGRKTKPSFEVIIAILSTNVDLNAEWLLTGKEPIFKSELVPKENINYKDLADARLQIIEMKDEKIIRLEKELSEFRYNSQKEPVLYRTVAEPAPELSKKKSK